MTGPATGATTGAATGVVFAPRMSDVEALMWRLERDPLLASTFADVAVLDRAPDIDRFRRRMEIAARSIPRLRQVARASRTGGAPAWVDDPEFDVDAHVTRIALPPPGSERQLLDLATTATAEPFDRTRPLWRFTVVEGLSGGRAALIQKVHHTIADGQGGVLLAMSFLDLERDAPQPTPHLAPDPPPAATATGNETDGAPHPGTSGTADGDAAVAAVRNTLAGLLRLPVGLAREVRALLAEPDRIGPTSDAAIAALDEVVAQLGGAAPGGSPLWTQRSTGRRVEVAEASLTSMQTAARALGGTLNAAFVTVAAEAAGRYHRRMGTPVESLRAAMPVSTRADGSGTNAFSLVRFPVPTGEMPLDERFGAVAAAAQTARQTALRIPIESIAAASSAVPAALLVRLARQQAGAADFAVSNVRGPDRAVYVAGAEVVRHHPIGPTGGLPFNLTLLSSCDRLDMGLHCDTAAVTRPELLREELTSAIARFTERTR